MPERNPKRIVYVITRLVVGGAQELLLDLIETQLKRRGDLDIHLIHGPQTGSEGTLVERADALDITRLELPWMVRQPSPWNGCAIGRLVAV